MRVSHLKREILEGATESEQLTNKVSLAPEPPQIISERTRKRIEDLSFTYFRRERLRSLHSDT